MDNCCQNQQGDNSHKKSTSGCGDGGCGNGACGCDKNKSDCGGSCKCENGEKNEACCGGKDEACVDFKEKTAGACCGGSLCQDDKSVMEKMTAAVSDDAGCCGNGGNCCK